MNSQYNNNENNMNSQYNNKMSSQYNQNMNNNKINNQNNFNNMNNPNFNQNNIMTQTENNSNKYKDIYPYINGDRLRITFITEKNVSKKVLIPSSLRNSELYYIADKINNPDFFEYSDVKFIELTYINNNNKVLIQNDDNIIEYYMNDGVILINEKTEIMSFNQNNNLVNIFFQSDKGKRINVIIPYCITVTELINIFFNKIKIAQQNQKYFSFFANNKELKLNNNEIYNEGINNGHTIQFKTEIVKNDYNYEYIKSNCPGKKISAFLKDKNEKSKINPVIFAGTLQQIKNFYQELKKYLSQQKIEFEGAPIINYQNKSLELDEDNENTFSSYGIHNDFICIIDINN
jgi:hypothetical protein